MSQNIYLLKVVLPDGFGRVRGRPYRLIAAPAELTLYDLAFTVVDAFDFDADHAFGFYDNIRHWTKSNENYELFTDMEEEDDNGEQILLFPDNTSKSVTKTKVNEVFIEPGKKILFLFDYGDEWHFIIQFKGTSPPKKGLEYPIVLESVGEPPPQYEETNDDEW